MREICTSGSVRGVDVLCMAEYCDTLRAEREEKQGIQSMPKQRSYITSTRLLILMQVGGVIKVDKRGPPL